MNKDYLQDLLNQFKIAVKIPKDYTTEDTYILILLNSSKIYLDNAINSNVDRNNELYKFVIIQLAMQKWITADDTQHMAIPYTITLAINQLKLISI